MTAKQVVKIAIKSAVALGSIAIINNSIDSENLQLRSFAVEPPRNLLLSQTQNQTLPPQTSQENSIQPVNTAQILPSWSFGILSIVGLIVLVAIAKKSIVVIGNQEVGIVIKKFNLNPSHPKLPPGQLVAVQGEAGPQAKVLTPGVYWGYFPWMYTVKKTLPITISEEEIGLVVAKGGANIPQGKIFGQFVECNDFQDGEAFIKNGGQKGKQLAILTTGTYWINSELFRVRKESVITIFEDEIGIVVAKDGANIPQGNVFGQVVECNDFQDADAFIRNGGQKGKQLAILTAGTYRINTELFEITKKPVINIPPVNIGLVVAKDGASMANGQLFGQVVECKNFQDADAFIKNGGQKGKQLAILPPGTYRINTELFNVIQEFAINIRQGEIGLVVAKDGAPTSPGQMLGKVVECNNFQDANAFIKNGGQKGKQLAILTAGTYQINVDLFTIITTANATKHGMKPEDLQVYKVEAGKIGIVTTYDGHPIKSGEIAGAPILEHDNFQNGQKFIDAGGVKGLQEEVLQPGSWNLNPWFVSVEQVELTDVPVGTVGVIISHVGKLSEHSSGVVQPGYKGVWDTPLYPGKHIINTKVMNVEIIPTLPITLDWSNKQKPPTNYDANLHSIQLRSKDGFCFDIEVTQVIRVAEKNAPTMIYRVGNSVGGSASNSIKALIVKVLQPAVSNYFCNSAQNSEALDFLDKRSDQQRQAKDYIKSALADFAVEAVDTLIGEIDLPEELEKILTDRKLSEERRKTIEVEQKTEEERQKLAHAIAVTEIQKDLAKYQQGVKIAELKALAEKYEQDAKIEQAREEAKVQAEILRSIVETVGQDNYVDIEKLKELVKVKLPEIMVSNSQHGDSGLTDIFAAPMLRTLITSTISSSNNNGLSGTYPDNKTLESSSKSTALPASYIVCTHCNTKNQLGNNFCSSCGNSLTN